MSDGDEETLSASESGPQPTWSVTDPARFRQAVRASEGAVQAVRTWTTLYSPEERREVPFIRVFYAVRAESVEGWGTFTFTENLPVERGTGRIAMGDGTMWGWLQENAPKRLYVDKTRSGAL